MYTIFELRILFATPYIHVFFNIIWQLEKTGKPLFSSMAADRADCKFGILRQFYSQIEAVLDPVAVARLLWQDGLLTDNQLDNAEQSSTPPEQRRADIMSAVRRVVRCDPRKLSVLITALEKFPASVPVANKMREALSEIIKNCKLYIIPCAIELAYIMYN